MISRKNILLGIMLLGLAVISAYRLISFYVTPTQNYSRSVSINVEPGVAAQQIIRQLTANQLLRSPLLFKFIVKFKGLSRKLKAGEYEFNTAMSPREIIRILETGQVKLLSVTLPEGITYTEVAVLLADKNLVAYDEFLSLCRSKPLLTKYDIPADSVEGYLYPDTYYFNKGLSANVILEKMLRQFQGNYANRWEQPARERNLSKQDLITLASIVEKEAKVDTERPIIAAVFLNRLAQKMRLESCATVIYALGHHTDQLTDEDLQVDSPYNTYRHLGLPPAPICNPGALSIEAVLNPAAENYLYFVAQEDGRHHFSQTFAEHRRAKTLIRKEKKK